MLTNTISQELLAIGAKTPLVGIIETYIKEMRAIWPDWPNNATNFRYTDKPWVEASTKFLKAIKKTIGVNLSLDVMSGADNFNAGVWSDVEFNGHSGSKWYDDPNMKVEAAKGSNLNEILEIDLNKVTVRGTITDLLKFRMYYTEAVMFNPKMFTVDEIVGLLLHEFGHIFNTFMTLGDYVWLNYYLNDGIEILMGRKQNKFKLQILSDEAIKQFVPDAEREAFINERNEDNAKRVILSLAKNGPRHHLTDNAIIANRREEQLADIFASRLGYGRAFASFQYKCDKYYRTGGVVGSIPAYANTLKAVLVVVGLPFAIMGALLYNPVGDKASLYDDSMLRITRVRRDLIAQLKGSPPGVKDAIVKDIEALDLILKEYSSQRDFFDTVVEFLRPTIRKMNQNTQVENDLESLFHNDLFVQAFKLSQV